MVSQVQGLWVQVDVKTQLVSETDVLEIIKRARKPADGEIVPWNQDVREEAIHRGMKAGYCASGGEPSVCTKIMSQGIGKSKLNIWPRGEDGNLIDD